jgi:hypothetical protein
VKENQRRARYLYDSYCRAHVTRRDGKAFVPYERLPKASQDKLTAFVDVLEFYEDAPKFGG